MKAWNVIPFAELLVESRDGEWGNAAPDFGLTEAVVIRGTDFAKVNDRTHKLPRRWIKDHLVDRKRLQAGDIVFEMAGGTSTQTTGRSALLKASFFESDPATPVLCASFSRHLRLDLNRFCPEFIYNLLVGLHRSGYMSVFHIQHTGVARFQYSSFKKHTRLKIPGLSIQRKIAAILTAYDDLIETNKRRIVLLEKLAEEIYREWFIRMRFPGHEASKLVKGVPEGWDIVRMRDLISHYIGGGWGKESQSAEFSRTAFVIRGTDIPRIQSGNLRSLPFRNHKPSNIRSRRLQADDFVFEVSGGSKGQLLGRNVRVSQTLLNALSEVVIPASFCKLIRFNRAIVSPYFMEFFLKLFYAQGLVGIFQVQSTGISNYQFESFLDNQRVITPPQALQRRFDQKVAPMVDLIDQLGLEISLAQETRDLLLPRLISGKLSVEDLDIQFPPSMLEEYGEAGSAYG